VLRGERPVIRSDGKFVRDYFYIEDGAAAYMLLAERLATDSALRGQAFNFSNESQISVLEMVDLVLTKMNSALRPEIFNQASNEIRHQYLCAERARTVLNWQPQFTLDAGLDRTVACIATFWRVELLQRQQSCGNGQRGGIVLMHKTPRQLRDEIGALVREYYDAALVPQLFSPGQSSVPVSGKVFDSTEIEHLVEASLDAWFTTGRFAAEFERDFAAFMGLRCASLVNSGSSANLLALSCLTSPSLADRALRGAMKSLRSPQVFRRRSIQLFRTGWYPSLSTFSSRLTTWTPRNWKLPSRSARGPSFLRTRSAIHLISTRSWLSPASITCG